MLPIPKFVTVVVGEDGLVIVPVPETKVQFPVPTDGEFPYIVNEVISEQIVESTPAFANVGGVSTVIVVIIESLHPVKSVPTTL